MTKFKLLIPCDEAQLCCDKAQYKEATLTEKLKLNIHLIFCKACQVYTKNNTKLTKLMGNDNVTSFEDGEKNDLESLLQKEINNMKE